MAIQNINFNPKPEKGVSYSAITDSSVDWTGITNNTYFYDKATDLPYYKNSSGTVISLFESGGGGGGNTLYSADGTLTGDRIVDLGSNNLTFSGTGLTKIINGSKEVGISSWNTHAYWAINNGNTAWSLISANASTTFNANEFGIANGSIVPVRIYNGSSVALGNVNKASLNTAYSVQTNGDTLIGGDLHATNGGNILQFDFNNYPKVKIGTAAQEWWLIEGDGTGSVFDNGDLYFYDSTNSDRRITFKQNNGGTIIGNNKTLIGTEDISLQGETLISEKLELSTTTDGLLMPRLTTAQMNAISSPDTHLLIFNTDLNALYRYNGTAWVAISAGYGVIEVITDSDAGVPTYFADLQSALETCKTSGSNNVIKLHSDISLSAQIDINTAGSGTGNAYQFKSLLIDGNGFEITFDDVGTTNAFDINLTSASELIFNNLKVNRTSGTGTHYALKIDGNSNQKLSMSNCYFYSNNGGAAYIQDITGEMFSLGGSRFESDGSIDTLTFRSFNMFFRDFITISNGTGDAVLNWSNGNITDFYCENTSTGKAYDSNANAVATFFVAKSNSGLCVDAAVSSCVVSNFYAVSASGVGFQGFNATNFYIKTGDNIGLLAGAYANLKNGYVENNSTSAAMDTNTIEYCHNITFLNLGSGYGADITNTINYNNKITNCTFISEGGIGGFLDTIATNIYNSTFISRYNNAAGHACEVDMNDNILMGCTFIVENSSANGLYSNTAVTAKVANCNFDGATTAINSNVTLSNANTSDAFGNILIG